MTTDSMVECVARAIYESLNGPGAKAWALLPNSHKIPYHADALVALEAMRDAALSEPK